MKKTILSLGASTLMTIPIIGVTSCAEATPEPETLARRDILSMLSWFNVANAQKSNHQTIENLLSDNWKNIDSNFIDNLNQDKFIQLNNEAIAKYTLVADKTIGKKVAYSLKFKTTNKFAENLSTTVKFFSNDEYSSSTQDETDLLDIKNQIGTIGNLNSKTINQLDAIVATSTNYINLTNHEIWRLGININVPNNMNGVSIKYSLTERSKVYGRAAEYNLNIMLTKNNSILVIDNVMLSSDLVTSSDVENEKNRIIGLLTNGKIMTNIADAANKLPSDVTIHSNYKPFNDSGIVTDGVASYYEKKSHNDDLGELTIKISLSKAGFPSDTLDVVLTGFKQKNVSQNDVLTEKNRVNALLSNGKIATNINNAINTLPSNVVISSTNKPFVDSGIVTNGVVSTYSKISHNDLLGEVTIEIVFSKSGQTSQTLDVILTGFKQFDSQANDIEKEKNRIQGLLNGGKITTNISNATNTLPSDVVIHSTNKLFDDSGIPTSGVALNYAKKSYDNSTGEITIEITFSKTGYTSQTLDVILTGFKQFDQSEDDVSQIESIVIPITNLDKQINEVLYSELTNEYKTFDASAINKLGVSSTIPSDYLGVSVEYKLETIQITSNIEGTYKLTIKISKGSVEKIHTYTMTSSNVVVLADLERARLDKLTLMSSYADASTTLPFNYSSIFHTISTQKPYKEVGDQIPGTTHQYTFEGFSNVNGLVNIAIRISDGYTSHSKIYEIYGFQTDFEAVNEGYIIFSNLIGSETRSTKLVGSLGGITENRPIHGGASTLGLNVGTIPTMSASSEYSILSSANGWKGAVYSVSIRFYSGGSETYFYFSLTSYEYEP